MSEQFHEEAERNLLAGKRLVKTQLCELISAGAVHLAPIAFCVLVTRNQLFEAHAQLLHKLYAAHVMMTQERLRSHDYGALFCRFGDGRLQLPDSFISLIMEASHIHVSPNHIGKALQI